MLTLEADRQPAGEPALAKVFPQARREPTGTRTDEVTQWWRGLAPDERHALSRDAGRAPPRVLVRFVEPGQHDDDPDASTDFYEHLVNHEVVIGDGRRFHICRAHPAARAVLAARRIPVAFRCPLSETACPMRALLDVAPGCDVHLSVARPV